MSSRMRVTKGHTGNRRSHHALAAPRLSLCSNCGAYHKRHRVCLECGFYRGNLVLEIKNKKALVTNADDKVAADKKDAAKAVTGGTTTKKSGAKGISTKSEDDLTKIEGIGPKIASIFIEAGIKTFEDLSASKIGDLRKLLEENKLSSHDPKTWSKQATMAKNGKWEELKIWQDELMGGK